MITFACAFAAGVKRWSAQIFLSFSWLKLPPLRAAEAGQPRNGSRTYESTPRHAGIYQLQRTILAAPIGHHASIRAATNISSQEEQK
ncbi:hypothetical protein P3C58_31145 [Mesorhizobium sp. XAP10]|uniref:hypothetical protein n=1 Tax=unclassified Mesorhizobium TaxID=325217 RepID=UPI0023DFAF20|nr:MULTISPECIES: hypothetical protein [unclassified Mesorhizobium]MDF3156415.1 hypothetical protein [Mesorhizobium sp. XAP10]MDF3249299.1 hypothetical protein [Mesorhizobium sp. XAP4]